MLSALTSLRLPNESSFAAWHAATPASTHASQDQAPVQSEISRTAAHFQREASRIHSASDLLNDPTSLTVVQQALGFSTLAAGPDRAKQAALLESMINFPDFQIPSRIQKFIELYSAHAAASAHDPVQGSSQGHGPNGVLPGQPTATVSENLLAQLPDLKVGGT